LRVGSSFGSAEPNGTDGAVGAGALGFELVGFELVGLETGEFEPGEFEPAGAEAVGVGEGAMGAAAMVPRFTVTELKVVTLAGPRFMAVSLTAFAFIRRPTDAPSAQRIT
jgi:hypothetical protein